MPGFLGGGGGGGGAGGEISFPKELIDPVTKLRVSTPETLIDTDFEYGLQPTKWETLELINNTPSFFSKSGDTTIDGITSMTTNAGTREITVRTSLEHALAVGIPINVTGSKSITADGAYIINSIPDTRTFTYLCKDNQPDTLSIFDLYTSIITGEFFQGSQIRISDAGGMTTDALAESTITVNLDSTHGFGVNTPFYFLNLNSSLSQQFDASNSSSKSFDASNSATAQTFDGSNTLSSTTIDYSNSATLSGAPSNITSTNISTDIVTVQHGIENFNGRPLGTPLYYSVTASGGYFGENPRGIVFLKTVNGLGTNSSSFQVSATPDGDPIDITATFTGTFQLANQARTFAGNNRNPLTEIALSVVREQEVLFDGGNQGFVGATQTNGLCTVEGYSGTILVSTTAGAGLDYYPGAMLRYSSTGTAATGLVNNVTYFVNTFTPNASIPNLFNITVRALPGTGSNIIPSGGSGVQTFLKIGVSADKDIIHIRDSNFLEKDMVQYTFPVGGRLTTSTVEESKLFYFVSKAYDSHNYEFSESLFSPTVATGGAITTVSSSGRDFRIHTFTTVGASTFTVSSVGTDPSIQYLVVGGGGAGGFDMGGGGGAGGYNAGRATISAGSYTVTVGAGGLGAGAGINGTGAGTNPSAHQFPFGSTSGSNSSFVGTGLNISALGGGRGGSSPWSFTPGGPGAAGGSGGGASGYDANPTFSGGGATTQASSGQTTGSASGRVSSGFRGGNAGSNYFSGGGGGAGGPGGDGNNQPNGGVGVSNDILGISYFWAGGGGGAGYSSNGGAGGDGGGGGGAVGGPWPGGSGLNTGSPGGGGSINAQTNRPGGNAGANTGGGGGGGSHFFANNKGGNGGTGIVVVRYPITVAPPFAPANATGGTITTATSLGVTYRIHSFTTVGTSNFVVSSVGSLNEFEYLIVAGGGGGAGDWSGGGGGGGMLTGIAQLATQTYPMTVGGGGAGTNTFSQGGNGGNSSGLGLTASGGGGGGADQGGDPGRPGGSGGGGAIDGGGGSGIAGQGFAGASGNRGANLLGGGGGGAGASGSGRQGGTGKTSRISGVITFYAGGGSGHANDDVVTAGGQGGGGAGHRSTSVTAGTNGLGGGGGSGSVTNGRAGGSGIIVVRYPIIPAPPFVAANATGGTVTTVTEGNTTYRVHSFTSTGTSNFAVLNAGSTGEFEYLIVAGGGGGGSDMGGGGGGGGFLDGSIPISVGSYPVVVGAGGLSSGVGYTQNNPNGLDGANSSAFSLTAIGGGGGGGGHRQDTMQNQPGRLGGSGGGAAGRLSNPGQGTIGQGFAGSFVGNEWNAGSGGGAGGAAVGATPGPGKSSSILGTTFFFSGGGGRGGYTVGSGDGGIGGGGGGAGGAPYGNGGGSAINSGQGGTGSGREGLDVIGGSGGANTGGGAGGHSHRGSSSARSGGSGIVVIRYAIAV